MRSIVSTLKNPLVWFALFLGFFAIHNNLLDGDFKNVIRSDGRGYYAYLPAIFLYNDPTFEASLEAETKHAQPNFNQYYLYQNAEGRRYNKYFPGIAILQAPFFGIGCIAAQLSGAPLDGYSEPFEFTFLLGSLFYSLLGLWLLFQCLQLRFSYLKEKAGWVAIMIYCATTLLMYNTFTLGLSHHYSFFLFTLFAWSVLKFSHSKQPKFVLIAGLTLGMIALVRPTNVLVVLSIPLLLQDFDELKTLAGRLFERKARLFLTAVGGFILIFSMLFILWKWQSGHWITWSYSGEGFTFFHPAFWENLFSFRIGLFLHTPIILVAAISTLFLLKRNRYFVVFWWCYFLVNTWVISSWWCWDYETSFGNRPFTEHSFFLLLPLLQLGASRDRLLWYSFAFFGLLGLVRYSNYTSGYMIDQRFTADNYLSSLAFWKNENHDRWRYPNSVVPFGTRVDEDILVYFMEEIKVGPEDEFIHPVEKQLPSNRTNERLYFRVWLDKQSEEPLEEVNLVIHAIDDDSEFTYYRAIPLINDRLEGVNEWASVAFSGQIPDHFNDFERVKIYIWNKGKRRFRLRNIRIFVDLYKS